MGKVLLFVFAAFALFLNALWAGRLITGYLETVTHVRAAIGAFYAAGLAFPLLLSIPLGKILPKAGAGTRYVSVLALLQVGLTVGFLQLGDLWFSDASFMFARLTDTPLPLKVDPFNPEPAEADAGVSSTPDGGIGSDAAPLPAAPGSHDAAVSHDAGSTTSPLGQASHDAGGFDAGYYYRYEHEGVIGFASSVADIPPPARAGAVPVAAIYFAPAPERKPVWDDKRPSAEIQIDIKHRRFRHLSSQVRDGLNTFRRNLGLEAVKVDAAIEKGAKAHAEYLRLNEGHESLKGLGAHTERAELPGFTEEGALAGIRSVIAFGGADPLDAWIGSFYHRIPLIQPSLTKVGFGTAKSAKDKRPSIFVFDTGDRSGLGKRSVVAVPKDGARGVPIAFAGREVPNPIPFDKDGLAGFPVTLTFFAGQQVSQVSAAFVDGSGRDVPYSMSTPESPIVPGYQLNTICLIADDPLRSKTAYEVRISAIVDGKKETHLIRFRTN